MDVLLKDAKENDNQNLLELAVLADDLNTSLKIGLIKNNVANLRAQNARLIMERRKLVSLVQQLQNRYIIPDLSLIHI